MGKIAPTLGPEPKPILLEEPKAEPAKQELS
jgi:hypothetical protein